MFSFNDWWASKGKKNEVPYTVYLFSKALKTFLELLHFPDTFTVGDKLFTKVKCKAVLVILGRPA